MADDPKQVDKDSGQGRAALHNKWVRRTITLLCILLVIVVALLVATALFDPFTALKSAWRWYFRSEPNPSMTERKDLVLGVASIIQAFAVLVAGVVALAGLYFTRRTLLHNQESTQETLDLTRRGQITERFTQAIDQLGATEEGEKNLEIRLGGIYSLERTAREDRDYHWPIMEVLTSYVRRNATPSELDIQAILNVIGRRSKYHRTDKKVEYGTIYLINTDLRGAVLRGAYLQGANLRDAVLEGADLRESILREAKLQDTDLRGADLQGAKLQEAFFEGANLRGAKLQGANLQEAILGGAILGGSFLQRANLRGAKLQGANLGGAHLQGADLQGANLRDAILRGADLRESILEGADVTNAQLADARFLQGAIKPDGSKYP